MIAILIWAALVLALETRTFVSHFKVSDEIQKKEKSELLDYLNQMRSYLGLTTFKRIAILSSCIINCIYIFYYTASCLYIDIESYRIISSFMIIDRIFKILETFELDFDKIDYVVGSDVVIGLRTLIAIIHVIITLIILIVQPIL